MTNIQQEVINGNINPYDLLDLWNEKPLDREDIESLGWIHEQDNLFSLKSGEVAYYLILYPQFDNKVEIRCTHPSINYGNFLGVCKNKSELKRILKQIGVL